MPKRTQELSAGYVPNELSFQVVPGSDEIKIRRRLDRMKSVTEIHQTVPGSEDFGSLYVLRVKPRFLSRVLSSLQSNPSIGTVGRVATRELADSSY